MNNNELRLLSAVAAFTIAATGVTAPLSALPSAEAFSNLGTNQELLIVHSQKTELGHKITLNNEDFRQISEGVQVQTFLDNNLYVMVDQVVVNTNELIAKHGFNYEVEFHFNYTSEGFTFQTYVKSDSGREQISIDNSVGIIVQIPQSMYNTSEADQLFFGGSKAEQLNDDGIIYAVLYEEGFYSVDAQSSADNATQQVVTKPADIYNQQQPSTQYEETTGADEDIIVVYNEPAKDNLETTIEYKDLARGDNEMVTEPVAFEKDMEDQSNPPESPVKTNVKVKTTDGYREEDDVIKAVKGSKIASATPIAKDTQSFVEQATNTIVAQAKTQETVAPVTKEATNPVFTDIQGSQYEDAILDLANKGIVKGYTDSIFMPKENITRGHFSVILARALNLDIGTGSTTFADVQGKWYESAVAQLEAKGYIIGTTPDSYSPDSNITKQQVATVVHRILETESAMGSVDRVAFTDSAKIAPYATKGVETLHGLGVFKSDETGAFSPNTPITRGEFASVVNKMLEVM